LRREHPDGAPQPSWRIGRDRGVSKSRLLRGQLGEPALQRRRRAVLHSNAALGGAAGDRAGEFVGLFDKCLGVARATPNRLAGVPLGLQHPCDRGVDARGVDV
jgi:hypothetical protein